MNNLKRISMVLLLVASLLAVGTSPASAAKFGKLDYRGMILGSSNNGSTEPLSYRLGKCTPICTTVTLPNGYVAGKRTLVRVDQRFPNLKWSESLGNGKRYKARWIRIYGRKAFKRSIVIDAKWFRPSGLPYILSKNVSIRPRQRRSTRFWVNLPECVSPTNPVWVEGMVALLKLPADPGWVCNPLELDISFSSNTLRSRKVKIKGKGKKYWWKQTASNRVSQEGAWIYPSQVTPVQPQPAQPTEPPTEPTGPTGPTEPSGPTGPTS